MTPQNVAGQAERTARQAVQQAKPWAERLARLGCAAKGVVYLLVGGLALLAAFTRGKQTTDREGALATMAANPAGRALLALLALGLFGYALWRFIQAFWDPEHAEVNAKRIGKRLGYALSGATYGALALVAARLVTGSYQRDTQSSTQDWTETLLNRPLGTGLVVLIGAFAVGSACSNFFRAWKAPFVQNWNTSQMKPEELNWAKRFGRVGHAARGVVFLVIGGFFFLAAIRQDPNEARGLDGALKAIALAPYGPWLLGFVALGLICYGLFMFVEARHRRIQMPT